MPFVQRENISQFLTACERHPLNLPAHDRFLTVDLYDNKDPAQVMQCLGAFSRAANAVSSSRFPRVIGPKRAGVISPTRRTANGGGLLGDGRTRNRGNSNASQGSESAVISSGNVGGNVSSWSKKSDETTTAPAWNIHQYGYMGGASQGNQGVSFGARRQIIAPNVNVPSLAEKEKRRSEQEAEAERTRRETLEDDRRKKAERETEQEKQRISEEETWQEETRRAREKERENLERERRKWEEEERRWKEEEERRRQEEEQEAQKSTTLTSSAMHDTSMKGTETERIKELERQLEEAKERERLYQLERAGRSDRTQRQEIKETPRSVDQPETEGVYKAEDNKTQGHEAEVQEAEVDEAEIHEGEVGEGKEETDEPSLVVDQPAEEEIHEAKSHEADQEIEESSPIIDSPATQAGHEEEQESDAQDEREALNQEWQRHQTEITSPPKSAPPPYVQVNNVIEGQPLRDQSRPSRPPAPRSSSRLVTQQPPASLRTGPPSPLPRPLPDPTPYFSTATASNRTDRYLAKNAPPVPRKPNSYFPTEIGMTSTSEHAIEDARRVESQAKTRAGGWASKGLLEREMEKERERQKEWEEAQVQRAKGVARSGGLLGPRELKR